MKKIKFINTLCYIIGLLFYTSSLIGIVVALQLGSIIFFISCTSMFILQLKNVYLLYKYKIEINNVKWYHCLCYPFLRIEKNNVKF